MHLALLLQLYKLLLELLTPGGAKKVVYHSIALLN